MKTRKYTLTAAEYARELELANTEAKRQALLACTEAKNDIVKFVRYTDK